ncbi:ribonuclease H-like domain-containing protein, partial [Lentinula lateritia]
PPHIGFDLEWKPNFRPGEAENPIAVIQIAFQTASYVVHVRWMRNLPDGLAEILENPRIVKVGVGIQNDAKKLFRDLRICLNSCVDLSLFFYASETFLGPHFHRLFRGSYLTSIGLARLAETYEGIVLTKGKITRSNWDLELSPVQITYAALDAYAGSVVYTHLIRLFSLLEPTRRPKREFYAFDCIRGTLYNSRGLIVWNPSNPEYDPGPMPPQK